jgi:hypothetical protein
MRVNVLPWKRRAVSEAVKPNVAVAAIDLEVVVREE